MPMDSLHVILEGAGNAESSKTAQNRDKGSIGENGADSNKRGFSPTSFLL
jgi:hypothetical protein